MCRFHCFAGHGRRRLRKRGEDASGVKPSRALAAEDGVPVNVTGRKLRDRGVAAIGAPDCSAKAVAALGEVEAIPHLATHAVVLAPDDVCLIDAALKDQVFNEAADWVIGERGDYGRLQPEAATQTARYVVLPAALPSLKGSSCVNAPLSRVQPKHHFA